MKSSTLLHQIIGGALRAAPTRVVTAALRAPFLTAGRFDRIVEVADLEGRLERHPIRFTSRLATGARYTGRSDDLIDRMILMRGLWEPNQTSFVQRRLHTGDVFVDIGANTGYYSLLSAPLVGPSGLVVAVEPSPTVFGHLQRNVAINRFAHIVTVNAAAGAKEALLPLYLATEVTRGKSSLVRSNIDVESALEAHVPVIAAADLLPADRLAAIRLIKIDVEGFEAEVVAGLAPVLGDLPDVEVMVEINPTDPAFEVSSIFDTFASADFVAYRLTNEYWPRSAIAMPSSLPAPRLDEMPDELADVVFSRRRARFLF